MSSRTSWSNAMPFDMTDHILQVSRRVVIYRKQRKFAVAEALCFTALSALEKTGQEDQELALCLYSLGEVYSDQDRYSEALPLYKRAEWIWDKLRLEDAVSVLWHSEVLTKMQCHIEQQCRKLKGDADADDRNVA